MIHSGETREFLKTISTRLLVDMTQMPLMIADSEVEVIINTIVALQVAVEVEEEGVMMKSEQATLDVVQEEVELEAEDIKVLLLLLLHQPLLMISIHLGLLHHPQGTTIPIASHQILIPSLLHLHLLLPQINNTIAAVIAEALVILMHLVARLQLLHPVQLQLVPLPLLLPRHLLFRVSMWAQEWELYVTQLHLRTMLALLLAFLLLLHLHLLHLLHLLLMHPLPLTLSLISEDQQLRLHRPLLVQLQELQQED
jgi:hypothetical protein